MSAGKLAAQVAHGAVLAAEKARSTKKEWFQGWIGEGQKKVVVKVPGKPELIRLRDQAKELGLPAEVVEDAGLTELPPGTLTVLGIGPGPSELVDKLTGRLPLLR